MANYLYVRTELTVPGVGSAIHMAEMEEQDARSCRMVRMIALDPSDAIVGVATPTSSTGNVDQPQEVVPHPDTYDEFPDISAHYVDQSHFDRWSRKVTTTPRRAAQMPPGAPACP